jgi:cation:H+ antiporter
MQVILLILGLVIIIKSADVMVDSASKIARRYGVSTFIIGITVVAFGTSAPELAVGIVSGVAHANLLTLGNIVGSSMSNMALIVGLSAVIFPLRVKDSAIKRELPILFAVQAALGAMILSDGRLSRLEGLILLAGFALFMFYIVRDAKASMRITLDAEGDIDTDGDGNRLPSIPAEGDSKKGLLRLWIYAVLSLLGLFIGGKLTVDSSVVIAQSLGLSETLIGLTVVAVATTMPELMTSIMAARKKEPDIVLGNCIGSNIFNVLLVLGLSSAISPVSGVGGLWFDMIAILLLTVFVTVVSLVRKHIRRPVGILLLLSYVVYIAIKVITALHG